jgi:flagellar hook-associated protein 1 FlgK
MSSEFAGLNLALSGLMAERQALDVAGHNVANANTEGYTRQRVQMEAAGGASVPAIFAKWEGTGAGVKVASIQRLNDAFLDARAYGEHGSDSALRATQGVLSNIELAVAEPSDNGVQAQLSAFWSAWDDVANNPGDLATRSQLIEQAKTVANALNQTSAAMTAVSQSSAGQINATIAQVNTTTQQIANLNQAIASATNGGLSPNDLLDQRDRLVDELAQQVGITVRTGSSNQVDIYIGGTSLVRGATASALTVDTTGGVISVRRQSDSLPVTLTGGSVGGLLDAVNNVIPKHQAALDAVAAKLVAVVNAQHQSGVDLNGSPGQVFFTGTGAADIAVNGAITADPSLIAAAAPGSGLLDGSNAQAMAELASGTASPDTAYRSFVNALGVDAQTANRQVDIQANITKQVDDARRAASSVDIDEEMTNMVAFQHGYEASSRVLTAVDSMIDTLVNHTGLVGRG